MLCLLYYLSGFFFLYYPAVRLPIQMKPIIPGQSVIPRQKYYLRLPPAKKFTKITVHPSMRHIFPKDISW